VEAKMDLKEILELERKHNEQVREHKLRVARHENKQAMINLGVHIISEQMKVNTMALFAGLDS